MSNININEDEFKKAISLMKGFTEGMSKNFKVVGSEKIRDCGITGDKAAQLNKLSVVFEESLDDIVKAYDVVTENVKSFIKDVLQLNEEDYFASCSTHLANATNGKVAERPNRFKK